jgi:hypothetical protein
MNKVVYIHRRKDDNSIFYVGMGSINRVSDKTNRNSYWNNVVNKYGYNKEVVAKKLSIEDAYELETFLIQEIGRKDLGLGKLVNMTDGGDGCTNWNKSRTLKMIKNNLKNMKEVSQYNKKGELVDTYRSLSFASKKTGINRGGIADVANKKSNTAGGYVWIYSNEEYIHNINKWDNGSIAMSGGKNPNSKIVLNLLTGVFYESLSLAFKSQSKYKMSAFRAQLNGQNKNKTNFQYV